MFEVLFFIFFVAFCISCAGNLKQSAWADWAQDRITDLENLNAALMEAMRDKDPPC